jgi:hypothetical protein
MPENNIPDEERFSLLLSMERLGGRVDQALSQISTLDVARSDHETRLRVVENEQATARGRAAVTGVLAGGGVSVVVGIVLFVLDTFGG